MKSIFKSEVFAIDCSDNYFAMEFFTLLNQRLKTKSSICISANNFDKVYEDLEKLPTNIQDAKKVVKSSKFLFLKNSWLDKFSEYGVKGINNELHEIINNSSYEVVFLNSSELFFGKFYSSQVENLIVSLISIVQYHNKKIVFSYNSQTKNGLLLHKFLKNICDVYYKSEKLMEENSYQNEIEIFFKTLNNPKVKISLLSDKDDFIKANKSIFSHEDIEFNTDNIDSDINILIINTKKQLEPTKIKKLKEYSSCAKLIYFTNENSFRECDKEYYEQLGADLLLTKNFDFIEYIKYVESQIDINVYTKKVKDFMSHNYSNIVTYEQLILLIESLNQNKIIYSVLSIKNKYLNEESNKQIRKYDFIHYTDENDTIFVLLNTTPTRGKDILVKRFSLFESMINIHKEVSV